MTIINVLTPIFAAAIGGWLGAFFTIRYQRKKDEDKMKKLHDVAIKALNIILKYAKQSYSAIENEFNTTITITEKRCIVVLLHKLGVPIVIPPNDTFNISTVHFSNSIIDREEIEGMIVQVTQGHCDSLFFLDAENYFNSNRQINTIREVGKKYVATVLAKSKCDNNTHQVTYPKDWVKNFGVGEYLSIRMLHEVACMDMVYGQDGFVIPEKIPQILHEIDLGIWDAYLFGNYEVYHNAKEQSNMINRAIQSMSNSQQEQQQSSK